jgi:hypothetical protein
MAASLGEEDSNPNNRTQYQETHCNGEIELQKSRKNPKLGKLRR